MTMALLLLIVLTLAAANGANDNIKVAATLIGSGLTDFCQAPAVEIAGVSPSRLLDRAHYLSAISCRWRPSWQRQVTSRYRNFSLHRLRTP